MAIIAASIVLWTATDAVQTDARVLPISRGNLSTASGQSLRASGPKCICPSASTRNLLKLDRAEPWGLAKPSVGALEPTTLKVLGIRVQFAYEDPDDPLSTGRGHFDLRDSTVFKDSAHHTFDMAPHNKRYFETHLRALHHYWNTVSNDKVALQWAVLPADTNASYQLGRPMSAYGRVPEGDSAGDVLLRQLRQLVRDAATLASDDVVLSDYDAVVIFHAGADRQSDVANNGRGDTPHDLFSGFVKLDSTLRLTGGSDSLVEAIIMPETESQDGVTRLLNGLFAHEFGHQLGLVDLYDTRNFATQVGDFSLMDNNAIGVRVEDTADGKVYSAFGALPVFPDAWSRAYLGFVDTATVTDSNRVSVYPAEELDNLPSVNRRAWRIPISSSEYYLIEYRRADLDGNSSSGLLQDSATNVILGPADTLVPGQPPELTREYDFLMPGTGMLIWHVDEGVAALDYDTAAGTAPNNFQGNTLQWDHDRRFLRLIEADGLPHLGSGPTFAFYTGDYRDFFYSPNNTELTPTSNPPSASNTGGSTGIKITRISGISGPGGPMIFDVSSAGRLTGFPVHVGAESGDAGAPIVTDLALSPFGDWRTPGNGSPEIFLGYKHYILAVRWDGTPLTSASILDTVRRFDDSLIIRSLPVVAMGQPDDEWIAAPLIANFEDLRSTIVAVSRRGRVYLWETVDRDEDGLFEPAFSDSPKRTQRMPSGPPILWEVNRSPRQLFIPTGGGAYETLALTTDSLRTSFTADTLTILAAAGRSLAEAVAVYRGADQWRVGPVVGSVRYTFGPETDSLLGPVLGDLDRDTALETIVADAGGSLWAFDTAFSPLPGFPVTLGFTPDAAPSLADMNRDGSLDILVVGDGRLYAYASNGVILSNFPIVLGRRNDPDTLAMPVVAADAGDGYHLAAYTGGGARTLLGHRGDGVGIENMPRPVGGSVIAPLAWAIDGQRFSAILARADDGYLYGFEVPSVSSSTPATAIWPMVHHDERHTGTIPPDDLEPLVVPVEFFFPERAFVYPNPAQSSAIVRYWLGDDADVTIKIYDLAGNLVTEASAPGVGGQHNEWTWSCADAASGVYFARLDLKSKQGGKTETVFCKMAVVQ